MCEIYENFEISHQESESDDEADDCPPPGVRVGVIVEVSEELLVVVHIRDALALEKCKKRFTNVGYTFFSKSRTWNRLGASGVVHSRNSPVSGWRVTSPRFHMSVAVSTTASANSKTRHFSLLPYENGGKNRHFISPSVQKRRQETFPLSCYLVGSSYPGLMLISGHVSTGW